MAPDETKILDFISGKEINATPEEIDAVQVFSRQLVEDYGYPKKLIQTRPQYRVKRRPSDESKEWPVDIAIFNNENHIEENIEIIVECKKKTRKDGKRQLENYLELSKAKMGVWFNGKEKLFIAKYYREGEIIFKEIPNIPNYGQRLEDIGKFQRKDLRKPSNLQSIFRTIRNYLAGNAIGVRRDEAIAQQMINIIFCKIYDEKFTKQDDQVNFRSGINENQSDVKTRILKIFNSVKEKYKDVISENDEIALDDKSINYVVGELQNYCLSDAERDAIGEAFEVFISGALKGGQGQFFTPRNVVQLLITLIDPKPDELMIDPACGSGGFLVEALKHKWTKIQKQGLSFGWNDLATKEEMTATAIKTIKGIEVDEFLSKVAKAYMAIIGDGKGGIFCEDSLQPKKEWGTITQQNITLENFDIVVTNPPFGKDIKVVGEETLSQYDLSFVWNKKESYFEKSNKMRNEMPPQILFIERCLQFLKNGGKLGIILPETFFHAPNYSYILQFLKNHNILWLVDLPHNTFRPHNNAKTIALILQKNIQQNDTINMAVAEEMGHDHNGGPIYRWDINTKKIDKSKIWDDITEIISELGSQTKRYTFQVENGEVNSKNIYVPRYYWNLRDKEVEEMARNEEKTLVPIEELINQKIITYFDGHGSPTSENKGKGNIPYIRVKDIVNWEIYKDPTAYIPKEEYERVSKGKKILKENDIIFVRRGSYRIGSVALVSPYDTNVLLTRELLVLRIKNIENKFTLTPFYLLYLLSSYNVQIQMYNKVLIETTLPNIADRWKELQLPIHNDIKMRQQIHEQVMAIFTEKWSATKKIIDLKQQLGDLTT